MPSDQANGANGWVSIKEAADLAGVSCQSIHNWIARGRVQPLTTNGNLRLDSEEFIRFLVLRRAASRAGLKIKTLQQWVDEVDADSAE